jgi:PKD repeat protein
MFGLYLVNNSTGTNGNTQYFWDFGDGTTSNAQYPKHHYANYGLYTVCLTIMDSNSNCYSTYCDTVGMDSNGNILKTSGFGITVIDEAMLGVKEQTTAFTGVNVYPNPSSGKFTFTIDSKKGAKMTMRVMNSMGQQVAQNETYLTTGSNKTQLDLSSLSDGLYFVNLRAGDEVKSVKLYLAR